jgi:hypothetical protein
MNTQNYCMVNEQTNVCDNITLWDGNTDTWTPPHGYLMLPQATTSSKNWVWDEVQKAWVMTVEQGQGQIGFLWDGVHLITQEPMPAVQAT